MPQLTSRICGVPSRAPLQEQKHRCSIAEPTSASRNYANSCIQPTSSTITHYTSTILADQILLLVSMPHRKTQHPRSSKSRYGRSKRRHQTPCIRPENYRDHRRQSHPPSLRFTGRNVKLLSLANRAEISAWQQAASTLQFTLKLFHDVVLNNAKYVGLIKSQDTACQPTTWAQLTRTIKLTSMTVKSALLIERQRIPKVRSTGLPKTHRRTCREWTYSKFPYQSSRMEGLSAGATAHLPCWPTRTPKRIQRYGNTLSTGRIRAMYKTFGGKPVHTLCSTGQDSSNYYTQLACPEPAGDPEKNKHQHTTSPANQQRASAL